MAVYRQSVRLGAKPLEIHDQIYFFQLSPCGHSHYTASNNSSVVVFVSVAAEVFTEPLSNNGHLFWCHHSD
jgi:hypothetical protein